MNLLSGFADISLLQRLLVVVIATDAVISLANSGQDFGVRQGRCRQHAGAGDRRTDQRHRDPAVITGGMVMITSAWRH